MERIAPELLKLRSSTAAYLAILRASTAGLEGFAAVLDADGPGETTRLLEAVQAAIGLPDQPGTPASIAEALSHLLGER